jgi:hypothetical protein
VSRREQVPSQTTHDKRKGPLEIQYPQRFQRFHHPTIPALVTTCTTTTTTTTRKLRRRFIAPWIFYIITSLGVKGSLPPIYQSHTPRICIRYDTVQIRFTQQPNTHTIPYQNVIPRDIQPPPPSSSYTTPPSPPPP